MREQIGGCLGLGGGRGLVQELGVMAKAGGLSFLDNENIIKLVISQLYEYTKSHCIVYF